jgi:hypothetical protein
MQRNQSPRLSGREPAAASERSRSRVSAPAQAGCLDGAHKRGGDNQKTIDFADLKRGITLDMVLSRYGILNDLKPVGPQFVGCCPIHHGSNPKQFVANLGTNTWYCFGDECDVGGGIIDFVALRENISVPHAARLLAEWFSVSPALRAHHHNERKTPVTTTRAQPSHYLLIVEERPNGEKPTWHRIAAAWPQRDGKGLTIQLPPGVSVSGRLILRENDGQNARTET